MSSSTVAFLEQFLNEGYIQNNCYMAAAALILYEHVITFDLEANSIWKYRMSGPTLILLINRYMLVLSSFANILNSVNWATTRSCEALTVILEITYIVSYFIAAAFTSLRVYAIIGRKWNLALLALLAGLVPAAANLYFYATNSYAQMVYVADTIAVCSYTSSISAQVFQRSMYIDSRYYVTVALIILAAAAIALRCCAIFSDAIAIAVTWSHTWSWRRSASESSQKPTLTAVMLRDGSGYFIVLVIISVLKLVTETEIIHNERWSQDGDYITIFLPSVTGILISRFMFNLRHQPDAQWKTNTDSVLPSDVDTQSNYPSDTHFAQSIQFAPKLVGNMSASLTFGASDTLLDDDDDELEDVGCNESDTADTEEKGGDELPDGGESGHLEIVEVTRIP